MAYCTSADVLSRVDTDMTALEVTSLIQESDAWLDLKTNMAALKIPMQRLLSVTLSTVRVMLKDPSSRALGDYSEDRGAALLKLNAMLDEMLKDATGGIGLKYSYERLPYG